MDLSLIKRGKWFLDDLKSIDKNGYNVFSCFHCAGGSTMGYKLAGYNVVGGIEIDQQIMNIYRKNHNPKYSFLMSIIDFNQLEKDKIPKELFNIDILDGSPPCSNFSMAGKREKKWGKKTYFREGQKEQILDDLFFHFIKTADILKPKVIVAENVKGMLIGNAKGYVKEIFKYFIAIGYRPQLFLLNSAVMGVPQARERIFFIANRLDKKIKLNFKEKPISVSEAIKDCKKSYAPKLDKTTAKYWFKIPVGKSLYEVNPKKSGFTTYKLNPYLPAKTQRASGPNLHWNEKRYININECLRIQSFPDDFICEEKLIHYICGMSVPPFMMQRIALEIKSQILDQQKQS